MNTLGNGEDWGKHLAKYVNENPNKFNSNEPRKITKAIEFISKVLSKELISINQHLRVSETGEFINLINSTFNSKVINSQNLIDKFIASRF